MEEILDLKHTMKQNIPTSLLIDVQQENGRYIVVYKDDCICEDCAVKGSYRSSGLDHEFGVCLKCYIDKTWLDKHAIITVFS